MGGRGKGGREVRKENVNEEKGKEGRGVPTVAQWVKNPTSIHEDVGLIPDLA